MILFSPITLNNKIDFSYWKGLTFKQKSYEETLVLVIN